MNNSTGGIRVLRLFSRLNIGGPAIHVILLTAGLRARGYDTRLVIGQESAREGNLLDFARDKGVDCLQIAALGREIRPLSDFRALWELLRLIRKFRPAVVHTHTAKAGVLGRIAARLGGVPVVVHTYHGHVLKGYFGRVKNAFYRTIEAGLARWSDCLVTVSDTVRAELVGVGVAPHHKIRVISLGLDLEALANPLPRGELRRAVGFPTDAPLVGLVGRLVPIKDVPTFLRAAARVRKSLPEARFAIVGDGEERPLLQREAGLLELSETVAFCGWHRDMAAVYGDLDVVVNCSRNEGTPVALIEAMAAGRPVVATRVGGTPDLLGDGRRGTLVSAADPDALADAILEALRAPDPAKLREARQYVLGHHSVARLLEDMDALYRDLLARHGHA